MGKIIIVSNKEWHRQEFNRFAIAHKKYIWKYVSNQKELLLEITANNPRYIFFLHWSWTVPSEIVNQIECVCFHMTDLPYGRGGSPLQNLILQGKTETKVTALRMIEKLDAGPIYTKRTMPLNGRAEEIYLRAGQLCWEMIGWISETEPVPQSQFGKSTFFRRRSPEQSLLPKKASQKAIYDFIRMLDAPTYPPAFVEYGNFRMEFTHADLINGEVHANVIFRLKKGPVNE